MKKIILIIIVLVSNSIFAQGRFILKLEPVKKYRDEKTLSDYFNIQMSYYEKLNDKFYYELQPGIIFADPALHFDFIFGFKPSVFYIKAGLMLYLEFVGGGNSGTATDFYSLPIIGIGGDLSKRVLLEFNYTVAYFTFGIGYKF